MESIKMEPIFHNVTTNPAWFSLPMDDEEIHISRMKWNINQIRFRMLSDESWKMKPWLHNVQMAATAAELESMVRGKLIMGWPKDVVLPLNQIGFSMKCLFWNCRGAGSTAFKNTVKDLCKDHDPEIIIILETKVPFAGVCNFFRNLGYFHNIIADPDGKVGGIWVIWDHLRVTLTQHQVSQQVVHAIVTRNNYEDWLLSAVYGNPNGVLRKHLWNNLKMVANGANFPWLVAGDFNDHLHAGEKKSFASSSTSRSCSIFANNIEECNLIDLGSSGPNLTWTNNRQGLANTMVKLDRALANPVWRVQYPEASVTNLPRTYSDHSPLILNLEGQIKINSDGSTFGEFGWASYGGLARDSAGRWIEGFCGRIGYATPLQAELWGIRRAMKLASERDWLEAIVETDSLTAVNLINKDDIDNHQDRTLIMDCRKLKDNMLLGLVHVLREGNKCADYLAKLGRIQGEQHMRIMVPANELVELLKADMQGVAYQRGD